MAEVERRLAPWRPRPHWGKLFATPPADLRERYPRFNDFADLVRRLDPTGKFRNAWLDALLPARAGS
jgi:xylitol oxidase